MILLEYSSAIRLIAFFGVFALMASWELIAPRRSLTTNKPGRWTANLLLTAGNAFMSRLILITGLYGVSMYAEERAIGFFNNMDFPLWAEVAIAMVVLDFIIYLQHLIFHHIPLFWRLHMMHHTDLDLDVTTGARFHPLEILLSMVIKSIAVIALGASPVAVVAFEIVLNGASMFNHSNVRIPATIDKFLRLFVVTPDMHRVHHSVVIKEFNSNFGFSVSWWDRLLGTYRAQPRAGHLDMKIGLAVYRKAEQLKLWRLLILPFRRKIQPNA